MAVTALLRHPASGHCLCDGRCHCRRPFPATAACNGRFLQRLSATAASCDGRRHRRRPLSATAAYNGRPLSATAAIIAAAFFLQRPLS
jgi:hypothetical protein